MRRLATLPRRLKQVLTTNYVNVNLNFAPSQPAGPPKSGMWRHQTPCVIAIGAGLIYGNPMNNQDGIREQIDFNTKLLQIGSAFLALIGSGLVAQIKMGVFDVLFWVGVGVAVILAIGIYWLTRNNLHLIKSLRQSK